MATAPTPSVQTNATFKPRIRRTNERGVFEVSSRTRPNLFHKVDLVHLECNCEAGQHQIRCWHLSYAPQAERVYQAIDAQHGRKTPLPPLRPPSTRARATRPSPKPSPKDSDGRRRRSTHRRP